jgi:RimJ/RimL family protein N-acetyltransferase
MQASALSAFHCYHRPMVPEGATQRLILRPIELSDAAQIQQIFPHWEIVRYLRNAVPWPYPLDGARQFLENIAIPQMKRGEAWHWTLRLKIKPEQVIGSINLRRSEENHRGFWLGLAWQGQGLMSEACIWTNDFWFEKLKFPVLRVSKAAGNLASRRISGKQGMRLVGSHEVDYVSGRALAEGWEITSEEWRQWKAARARLSGSR